METLFFCYLVSLVVAMMFLFFCTGALCRLADNSADELVMLVRRDESPLFVRPSQVAVIVRDGSDASIQLKGVGTWHCVKGSPHSIVEKLR